MNGIYSLVASLQCENKALRQQIDAFKSGKRYIKLTENYGKIIAGYKRTLCQKNREIDQEKAARKRVRDMWMDQCTTDWEEYQEELDKKIKYIQQLENKNWDLLRTMDEKIISLRQEYEGQLAEKDAIIDALKAELAYKEALLGRNGTNTGLPTSKTPIGKNKVIPNTREKSGKPKGGQAGHKQHVLEAPAAEDINNVVSHALEPGDQCPGCGSESLIYTGRYEEKYVYDVKIQVERTLHKFWLYECANCGEIVRKGIDPNLRANAQYGPTLQALALSLTNTANASMNKTAMFLAGITHSELTPCEGYIAKLQGRAAKLLVGFYADLRILLLTLELICWDDTVIYINTTRACFRFYGNEKIAYYTAHMHKDLSGLLEDNVLPLLTEDTRVMHDHNTVNYNPMFSFENVECNQHAQRDGRKSTDNTGHTWSAEFEKLVSSAIKDRKVAEAEGKSRFDEDYVLKFNQRLDEIQALGEQQYAADAERLKNYGAPFERALLNRIAKHRRNYFAWLEDFSIPTTNNVSERSLRRSKTKMKVSGQFESEKAAQNYAVIQSYVETCRRNGINEIDALRRLCEGNPYTVDEIFGNPIY